MNTIENNKLIAEFMGFDMIEGNKIISVIKYNQLKVFNPNNSWNWLMEVVEKIESLGYDFNILTPNVVQIVNDEAQDVFYLDQETGTKVQSVYNACLEFIKWHNQQNTKP